jgi:hypothetical protein
MLAPMKKLLFVVGLLLLATPSWAQDAQPSFTGKWTLDLTKSDFGPTPPPDSIVSVIEHNEPNLKITTTQKTAQGEFVNERTITTDGKPNTNKVRTAMGEQDVTSTTKWNGKMLTTNYKLDMQGMSLDITDAWELSADGKVLTMNRNISTPQGDFTQKTVFNKQ